MASSSSSLFNMPASQGRCPSRCQDGRPVSTPRNGFSKRISLSPSCVGVEEDAAADIDLYHCPNCQLAHGPSVMKRRRGPQRQQDAGLSREAGTTVRTGSAQFIKELRARTFPSADEVILKPSGAQLTVEFLEENSFSVPILVLKKEGLGMTLPPPSFTVRDIEHHVGPDREIDVIDVSRQADLRMRLGDFVSYFCAARRDKVLNVISLEFSESRLSNLVETPKIVRKLSWVENLWPGESVFERPSVQKYCLMGTQGSYTDFHIDFGGTSVWYHVLWGEKIFYLVRPSPANLARFEAWSSSSNQSETFFGDQAEHCYRCPLRQGQTLFIPTGWIHAVLTPVDCLAFGGNFLHSLNIEMQLKAYEIEKRLSTADLFRFPNFETICWYVGKHLLDIFRGLRENRRHPATYLVHGAKALNTAFRAWTRREVLEEHEDEIPGTVRPAQLIKDLAKEIRLVEVRGTLGTKGWGRRCSPLASRTGHCGGQGQRLSSGRWDWRLWGGGRAMGGDGSGQAGGCWGAPCRGAAGGGQHVAGMVVGRRGAAGGHCRRDRRGARHCPPPPPLRSLPQEHQRLQRRKSQAKRRAPSPKEPELEPEPEPDPEPELEPDPEPEPEAPAVPDGTTGAPPTPEPKAEPYAGSLADHEYTARPSLFGMAQLSRSTTPMAPGVFLSQRRPSAGAPGTPPAQGKRPKKGLATAKQRLGRILKIHRNGKLLL
ncbi:histone lysine demethylase PHF8 [Chelonoidis abingdonii]|uniref:histone lysine demethylase PHF8 n=1 Tax=Chelonoidis abingdonii TaxID=106734 RepID=UPI003F494E62